MAEAGKAQRALDPPDELSVGQQSSVKSDSFNSPVRYSSLMDD